MLSMSNVTSFSVLSSSVFLYETAISFGASLPYLTPSLYANERPLVVMAGVWCNGLTVVCRNRDTLEKTGSKKVRTSPFQS